MRRAGTTLATIAHLVAVGVLGTVALTVLVTWGVVGVAMVPTVGIGLVLLALLGPVLYATARVEEARVSGLLGLSIPPHPMRRSDRTDWLRVPHTAVLQYADRATWRAVVHLVIITLLGLLTAVLLHAVGGGIGLAVHALGADGPLADPWFGARLATGSAVVLGLGVAVVGVVLTVGLAVAHRALSEQLLVPSREAELTARAETATRRRDDAMRAADVERTRIERDLHDGVQPRLVSVGMTLGMARAKLASDPEAAAALIDEAHTSTKAAITELRQLARGIHPAVLDDRGLDAALSALAARSHVPVHLDVRIGRCSKETEAAMYFAVAESLTNAAKHSQARACRVTVTDRPGAMVWARVEDDGVGGATRVPGGGIDGVANRVAAAGGTFSLVSPAGGPTTIEVSLPCGS